MKNSANTTPSESSYWTFPEGLGPLASWLTNRGVNIHTLNSDREALHFVTTLSYRHVTWPKSHKSAVPALLRLQKELCTDDATFKSNFYREKWPMAKEPFLKSTGPASSVRSVSPETVAEITKRYCLKVPK